MTGQQHTGTGDEADGIIAVLRILPKLDVPVVENVLIGVHIVEGLRRQHHPHIVSGVEQWQRLQEEVRIGHLCQGQNVRARCQISCAGHLS